ADGRGHAPAVLAARPDRPGAGGRGAREGAHVPRVAAGRRARGAAERGGAQRVHRGRDAARRAGVEGARDEHLPARVADPRRRAHHPARADHRRGVLSSPDHEPERLEDARHTPSRRDRPHGGDGRRRDRRLRGGRDDLSRPRGEDHARRRRRDAPDDAPPPARRMKLLQLRRRDTPVEPAPEPEPPPRSPWRQLLRLPRRPGIANLVKHNPGLKLLALAFAFFLWFSINVGERDARRTLELPVSVRTRPSFIVTEGQPDQVEVTLSGPRTILDGVDDHKTTFTVDLTHASPGVVRVDPKRSMVHPTLNRRLDLVSVKP